MFKPCPSMPTTFLQGQRSGFSGLPDRVHRGNSPRTDWRNTTFCPSQRTIQAPCMLALPPRTVDAHYTALAATATFGPVFNLLRTQLLCRLCKWTQRESYGQERFSACFQRKIKAVAGQPKNYLGSNLNNFGYRNRKYELYY